MLRIFYGPDTYSRAEAVTALKSELDGDGMLAANTAQFEGAGIDLAVLMATCNTVPFLSSHRLVIVNGLLAQVQSRPGRNRSRGRARTDESPARGFEPLIDYIPHMPPTTNLLLVDGALRSDNTLLKALRPMAEIRSFPQKGEQEILAWIAGRARSSGASLEPRALSLLAESVHGDLWTLASELEKLTLYAAGRTVTESDVRNLVRSTQESNIFAMIDAIIAGRPDQALQQLRRLLNEGAAGPYIITMIARQYRQLLIAEDLLSSGSPVTEIGHAADIRSEIALRRVIQQARRLGTARLTTSYERVLNADLAIKRGEMEEAVALELLVTDLVGAGAAMGAHAGGRTGVD